jgi:uncharacterized coiled-coil DUF342 family protein
MEATDIQKEIVKLLLARLKACALESAAFRAAIFNFSEQDQKTTMEMVESYRQAEPIRKKVEMGFQDLDSLIQQVDAGLQDEEVRKLLARYAPDGLPN